MAVKLWMDLLVTAWRTRRTDEGGVSDEVAMIGLMLVAAVAVGGIIWGLVTGAAGRLDFGF
ncbi:MAG TPA: hypothetical protein VGO78_14455 [Acidimicrobiales bacterium]|jgi:hypothetical protein|nr:hypothetical protein [Acidimicrobiales bacterium]